MFKLIVPRKSFPEETYLKVRPFGLFVQVSEEYPEVDTSLEEEYGIRVVPSSEKLYKGVVKGRTASKRWFESPIEFTLPVPDKDGFFKIGQTLYMICRVGLPSPWRPLDHGEYFFLDKEDVAQRILEDIFAGPLPAHPGMEHEPSRRGVFSNFFFQSGKGTKGVVHVNNTVLQNTLLSRLSSHPWTRQVKDTKLSREGFEDTVLLYPIAQGIGIDPLKFREKMLGKFDLTSTSSSKTINRVYQLAEGARIENMDIVPSNHVFCSFTRKEALGLVLSPDRAHLCRSAVMGSASLVNPEERPAQTPESNLHTRNLITAIMDLGEATYEECIAISQTCANELDAYIDTKISCWSKKPLDDVRVSLGDIIRPGEFLAKETKLGEEKESITRKILASNLRHEGVLEDISMTPRWKSVEWGFETVFIVRQFAGMLTGDKISCFSGYKGVVKVIEDSEMPMLPDGRTVDLCLSPISVAKRGVVLLLMEMALGRAAEQGEEFEPHYADEFPLTLSDAMRRFGQKEYLSIRGKDLSEPTYWGIMPWFRLERSGIAKRRASAVGVNRPRTAEGTVPDVASVSGQRLERSKAVTMLGRLPKSLHAILSTGTGLETLLDTVNCIEGPANEFGSQEDRPEQVDQENPERKESQGSEELEKRTQG